MVITLLHLHQSVALTVPEQVQTFDLRAHFVASEALNLSTELNLRLLLRLLLVLISVVRFEGAGCSPACRLFIFDFEWLQKVGPTACR